MLAADGNGGLLVFRQGNGNGRWGQQLIDDGYLDSGSRDVLFCPSWEPIDFYIGSWDWRTYGSNLIESEHTQIFRDTGPEMFAINAASISDTSSYFLLADSYHPNSAVSDPGLPGQRAR